VAPAGDEREEETSVMIPTRVTIHCSASKNGQAWPAVEIRKFHMAAPPQGRGFKDIGYHLVIQPDGQVERGRGLNAQGAHVMDAAGDIFDVQNTKDNEGNIGICLVGDTLFTREQFDALRSQLESLRMTYSINSWEIRCHNQFRSAIAQGKTCPNMEIGRILAWYIGHHEKAIEQYLLRRAA